MIIYGIKSRLIARELVVEKCPSCGRQNSTELFIYQKYAHLFWIPFFPTGKHAVSQCDHCKKVLERKEMTPAISAAFDIARQQLKTPWWTFSGAGLLAILVSLIIILDQKNDEENLQFVDAPMQGDVFEMKTDDGQYLLALVARVQTDSVFIRYSDYETNKISGLASMKRKGNGSYSPVTFGYLKKDLKNMLSTGEIIDIDRE